MSTNTADLSVLQTAVKTAGLPAEYHYGDIAPVRKDGGFVRGWLPDFLPDTASDIWEFHRVESPQTWGCFMSPSGLSTVREVLGKVGRTTDEPGCRRRPTGIHRLSRMVA